MTLTAAPTQAGCALIAGGLVVLVRTLRQRALISSDGSSLFMAIFAGFNIPKGLFLCWYLLDPDPPAVATKLHGYEKEIFAGGALIVFLALASLWSLCVRRAE
jgi:hypothetical protein